MVEKLKPEKVESKEQFENQSKVIIDFIRHGEPAYGKEGYYSGGSAKKLKDKKIEYKYPPIEIEPNEAAQKALVEGKLTPKGIGQIEKTTDDLISSIDKEREIVMLLVSPKTRALESGGIVKSKLEQAGIKFQKTRIHHLLEDMQGGWIAVVQSYKDLGKTTPELWKMWRETKEGEELKGLESYESVTTRTKKLISVISRYANIYKDKLGIDKGKNLRVICVGHGELVDHIARENFGVEEGKGVEPAAVLEVDIKRNDKVNLRLTEREKGRKVEKELTISDIT